MKTQRLQRCTRSGPCCAWWECRGQLYDKISKTLAREGYKSIVPQEWGKKRMGWKTEHNMDFHSKEVHTHQVGLGSVGLEKEIFASRNLWRHRKKVKVKISSGSRQCTSTCPGPLSSPPAACRSSTRGRLAGCTTPSMSGGFLKKLSKWKFENFLNNLSFLVPHYSSKWSLAFGNIQNLSMESLMKDL